MCIRPSARDHAVISAPVYRLDGAQVASGASDLWDGGSISVPINYTQNGTLLASGSRVWTGSSADGTRNGGNELGTSDNAGQTANYDATANSANAGWLYGNTWFDTPGSSSYHVYAVSEPITVMFVPSGSLFRFR